jgi:ketosteroid isomerase-like protein
MASANVELVRSIFAAWERGDWRTAEWAHPEIEYVFADGPSPGTRTGLAAMGHEWRDFLSAWEELRAEPDEVRELDGERVLVLFGLTGQGKTSELSLAQMRTESAALFLLGHGKVIKIVTYWDHNRAFDDLGLISDVD